MTCAAQHHDILLLHDKHIGSRLTEYNLLNSSDEILRTSSTVMVMLVRPIVNVTTSKPRLVKSQAPKNPQLQASLKCRIQHRDQMCLHEMRFGSRLTEYNL